MVREPLTKVGECPTLDRMSISGEAEIVTSDLTAHYTDTGVRKEIWGWR
jgi:hypothetical protein